MCILSNVFWGNLEYFRSLGPYSNSMLHVLRLDESTEKSNLSPFFSSFLVRMFVLQQVPVYLTPERASELAIVSAHRREEPALNSGGGDDRGVGASVAEAAHQRQQKPLGEGDVDLIPALAGIHDERFHKLVKSSSPWSLVDYRRTFCEVDPFLANWCISRPSHVKAYLFPPASRVRKH